MKDYAKQHLDADYIATGHYARLWHRCHHDCLRWHDNELVSKCVEESMANSTQDEEWIRTWGNEADVGSPLLISGADLSKDQSYFLTSVSADSFRNVLFPLGNLKKNDDGVATTRENVDDDSFLSISVREIASRMELPNAKKRDSMGICFVGKRNFADFISDYLPQCEQEHHAGNFIDIDTGQIVGKHSNSVPYTIGQGARIPGASLKWFVVGQTPDTSSSRRFNDILVCNDTHHPALYSDELVVKGEEFNWIVSGGFPPPPLLTSGEMRGWCRTRHLRPLVPCHVSWCDTLTRDNICIRFESPVRALTPGQNVALYVGDNGLVCVGGGPIWDRGLSYHERDADLPLNFVK